MTLLVGSGFKLINQNPQIKFYSETNLKILKDKGTISLRKS